MHYYLHLWTFLTIKYFTYFIHTIIMFQIIFNRTQFIIVTFVFIHIIYYKKPIKSSILNIQRFILFGYRFSLIMNINSLLFWLICTRQVFHYICKDTSHTYTIDLSPPTQVNHTNSNPQGIIKQFMKFPSKPKFIKNIDMDNSRFLFMLLTMFL